MRLTIPIFGAVFIGVLVLSSCASRDRASTKSVVQANDTRQPGVEESDWQKVDAGAFSILTPSGWKLRQLQGADSYVGEFIGDGIVLRFDFGGYSNRFGREKKPAYIVVQKSIGGLPAKIVSPKTPGHGIVGVYFPRTFGSNKLSLFGQDLTPTQQELVLKIFETIRFGRAVPPTVALPSAKNRQ